jgi:hypothetical protein
MKFKNVWIKMMSVEIQAKRAVRAGQKTDKNLKRKSTRFLWFVISFLRQV